MQLEFGALNPKQETNAPDYNAVFAAELERLNPAQREAVEHIEGPVLVVAGPGTGKTQIIAARIGRILQQTDTDAHQILCLTYTDAGTIAMRQRLLKFIGPAAHRVHIYTFHAFCNDVIQANRELFGLRDLQPISDLEKVQLMQELIDEQDNDHPIKRLKGMIYYEISRLDPLFRMMKEENWTPEEVERQVKAYIDDLPNREEYIYKRANKKQGIEVGDPKQSKIDEEKEKMDLLLAAANLFPLYNEKMKANGRYDYSDMILWVLDAFKKYPNLLRSYQEQYLYFLVDEYQDTNGAQNNILQRLIDFWDVPNVFVVGDDDQSIYEFQGARVKNIMDFYHAYKSDLKLVVLTDNYRSTQAVLDSAKSLIDHNQGRLVNQIEGLDKLLKAKHDVFAASEVKPLILEYHNVAHEEAGIVNAIQQLKDAAVPLNEVAVIYRQHKQADELISQLEKLQIPYQTRKKINILNEPLIRNLLKVLQYLHLEYKRTNSGEYLLFEIMHFAFAGIPAKDVALLSVHAATKRKKSWRDLMYDKKELKAAGINQVEAIQKLDANLSQWQGDIPNVTLQELLEKVINRSGLLQYVLESPQKEWQLQLVNTFFDFVKEECSKQPKLSLASLLGMIEQMQQENIWLPVNKILYEEAGVQFLTAHASKGLEFQYVFLMGCTKDSWESSRSGNRGYKLPDTLTFSNENENTTETGRRLFYVAMTRAKEHLYISYAQQSKEGKELEHSQFVDELLDSGSISRQAVHLSDEAMSRYASLHLQEAPVPPGDMLDSDFLNSKLENYVMSVTHLNKYLRCPVAFYYESILKVPMMKGEAMAFGDAVHDALYKLFHNMLNDPRKEFEPVELFLKFFKNRMYQLRDHFTDQQYERRLAYGEKLLPDYYEANIEAWEKNKVVRVEERMDNIEVAGVPIKGFIDKVELDGRDANVIDYKTGNPQRARQKMHPPNEKEPNGGDYWRQLVFYKILSDNHPLKRWNMVSGEVVFLEKEADNKPFTKEKLVINREDVETVTQQIKSTYEKIMKHEFSEGCGEDTCFWCNFTKNNFDPVAFEQLEPEAEA